MDAIKGKKILVGISSSIAAYKTIELIKSLKSKGADVRAVMTGNAEKLIHKDKFGCEVYTELFSEKFDYSKFKENPEIYIHITLAKFPELIILAPATANLVGKIANGIADDLLLAVLITTKAKVFVCPAMNVNMWENAFVQENVSKLRKAGFHFVGPELGDLACGDKGFGRMSEPAKILDEINRFFEKKDSFKGKKVVVTVGALSEKIDAVRVITNKSSGKMGISIADEFAFRGADVVLIAAQTSISQSEKMFVVKVDSADEMLAEIKKNKDYDIIVHCAAVPDFKVRESKGKLSSEKKQCIELIPAKKILDTLKKINPKGFVVGFKAETDVSDEELVEKAFEKLKKSSCDLIVANIVSSVRGFGSAENEVFIIGGKKNVEKIPLSAKKEIAERIAEKILLRQK